jgi:signal transduction histidine kinase
MVSPDCLFDYIYSWIESGEDKPNGLFVVTSKLGRSTYRVTGLSFLLVTVLAVGAALLTKQRVLAVVEEHLYAHSIEHNREIARRAVAAITKQLNKGMPRHEVLARFRFGSRVSDAFGYTMFLIDIANNQVISHSGLDFNGVYPRPEDLFITPTRLAKYSNDTDSISWLGALQAKTRAGEPVLLYLTEVDTHWKLGVESGVHTLPELEQMLADRLVMLIIATIGSIALLGFLAVRGIGRLYERNLEHEVQDRAERLAAAQAESLRQTQLATIGEAASLLAHEMRNPLASIQLGLSELTTAALEPRQRRRLDLALEQVRHLEELLSEVLDAARTVRLSPLPVKLDSLLDDCLELLEPELARKQLRVTRQTCPDCPALRLDTRLMSQALLNLLKNAQEASPEEGQIDIVLTRRDDTLELVISNAAPVMAAAELERAFAPFVSSKPHGTGLGLPMVKRVVTAHAGDIQLASDSAGMRCIVTLPAA